jgi:quinol-cytochrome oxidoreductase complex cytochrome b subunit
MAMKETARSLRAYFFLVGIVSGGNYIVSLNVMAQTGAIELVGATITVVGLGLAIAYVYLGTRLNHLLVTSPQKITAVLIAGAIFLVVLLLLNLLGGLRIGALIYLLLGLLITWYLYANAKRLAGEARGAGPTNHETSA